LAFQVISLDGNVSKVTYFFLNKEVRCVTFQGILKGVAIYGTNEDRIREKLSCLSFVAVCVGTQISVFLQVEMGYR